MRKRPKSRRISGYPVLRSEQSELSIPTWNYKWDDPAIRHIGPMAQDFAAAFGVGEDDKHICPVDAQGVAFAAIQGLYRIVQEKEAQTESLQAQLQHQQAENQALRARVEALERLVKDALGVMMRENSTGRGSDLVDS